MKYFCVTTFSYYDDIIPPYKSSELGTLYEKEIDNGGWRDTDHDEYDHDEIRLIKFQ